MKFPLEQDRAFDPPEAPIEALEVVWRKHNIRRAVLIQGSAYGTDNRALVDGIARDPENRRGVAIVKSSIGDHELLELHAAGVRGVRFNWVKHLLQTSDSEEALSVPALQLLERVAPLGWHAELHIDEDSIALAETMAASTGQLVVIDHMGRIDASIGVDQPHFQRLLRLLEHQNVWVKLSGADRITSRCGSLSAAVPFVSTLAQSLPDRCIWGLDWPHVNLDRKQADADLIRLLEEAVPVSLRKKILQDNPARLYGFSHSVEQASALSNEVIQGAGIA